MTELRYSKSKEFSMDLKIPKKKAGIGKIVIYAVLISIFMGVPELFQTVC